MECFGVLQVLVKDIPPCDLPEGRYPGCYDLDVFWYGVTMSGTIGSCVGAVGPEHYPVEGEVTSQLVHAHRLWIRHI